MSSIVAHKRGTSCPQAPLAQHGNPQLPPLLHVSASRTGGAGVGGDGPGSGVEADGRWQENVPCSSPSEQNAHVTELGRLRFLPGTTVTEGLC